MVHLHGDVRATRRRRVRGRRAARPRRPGGADRISRQGDATHGRRPDAARDDLRPEVPQGAGHRRQDRRRPGAGAGAGRRPAPTSSGSATPSRGRSCPGFDAIAALPQVTLVPLDLTNERSVSELAGEIGGKVDIVDQQRRGAPRASASPARRGTDVAARRDGHQLLRPAAAGAGVRPGAARAARPTARRSAIAWVNLLSIYALANFPPHGTFSASKAAAHSLAQCLRAEMRPAGIRVINVFPGPIDDEWNQTAAAAQGGARRAGRGHRQGAARRHRGRLPRRRGAGMAGALARQPQGARARARGGRRADERRARSSPRWPARCAGGHASASST